MNNLIITKSNIR